MTEEAQEQIQGTEGIGGVTEAQLQELGVSLPQGETIPVGGDEQNTAPVEEDAEASGEAGEVPEEAAEEQNAEPEKAEQESEEADEISLSDPYSGIERPGKSGEAGDKPAPAIDWNASFDVGNGATATLQQLRNFAESNFEAVERLEQANAFLQQLVDNSVGAIPKLTANSTEADHKAYNLAVQEHNEFFRLADQQHAMNAQHAQKAREMAAAQAIESCTQQLIASDPDYADAGFRTENDKRVASAAQRLGYSDAEVREHFLSDSRAYLAMVDLAHYYRMRDGGYRLVRDSAKPKVEQKQAKQPSGEGVPLQLTPQVASGQNANGLDLWELAQSTSDEAILGSQ